MAEPNLSPNDDWVSTLLINVISQIIVSLDASGEASPHEIERVQCSFEHGGTQVELAIKFAPLPFRPTHDILSSKEAVDDQG